MPFSNAEHAVAIFNGSYNDVRGDQITTHVYSSEIHIKSPATFTAATASSCSKTVLPFTMPTKEPYVTFIALIIEIQEAFHPIVLIADEDHLQAFSKELPEVLTTTALVGRLIELLEMHFQRFNNMVWFRRISNRVQRWVCVLQTVVKDIHRYRYGLKDTMIGPIWARVYFSGMQFLSKTGDIESIVRAAHFEMIKFKEPLVGLLECLKSPRDGILQSVSWWVSRHPEIQPHFNIPRYRPPHSIIQAYDYKRHSHFIPYHPYMVYQDVSRLMAALAGTPFGWVDPEDEKLLSPHKLYTMVRQRSVPQVTVEPVYTHRVIVDSGIPTVCPNCDFQSVRDAGEWRVCDSCDMRFQNVDKTSERVCSFDGAPHHGRYVMVEYFDYSSLTHLCGAGFDSASVLPFFQHLSDIDAPMSHLKLHLNSRIYLPSIRIPERPASKSGPPMLRNLQELWFLVEDGASVIPEMILPQIRDLRLYALQTPASPSIDVILTYRALSILFVQLKWDSPLDSILRLLSGLPKLKNLTASNFPDTSTPTLIEISEMVQRIRTQAYAICSVNVETPSDAEKTTSQPPEPWIRGVSGDIMLDATRL